MKFTEKEITDLIEQEIQWSEKNRGSVGTPWSEDYKDGFIVGLRQAVYLIEHYAKSAK